MYSEIMDFFGLTKDPRNAGYFETEHYKRILKDVKPAIHAGGLIAITGIIGIGKTTTLQLIQSSISKEKDITVSKSLSVEKNRVTLGNLISALFTDLATEKNFKAPTQPEKRERTLQTLIRKSRKPVALFIDEAHDLHGQTLIGLKRLIEVVQDGGGVLSVVLIGHPKLKNDLSRSSMEEIGHRSRILTMNGIKGYEKEYIEWLLKQCSSSNTKPTDIFTEDAINMLAERLITPLQMVHYIWKALEEAYIIAQNPVSVEVIESTLSPNLNDIEARLIRHGYSKRALCETLNASMSEINLFLQGQLTSGRTFEFQKEIQKLGII